MSLIAVALPHEIYLAYSFSPRTREIFEPILAKELYAVMFSSPHLNEAFRDTYLGPEKRTIMNLSGQKQLILYSDLVSLTNDPKRYDILYEAAENDDDLSLRLYTGLTDFRANKQEVLIRAASFGSVNALKVILAFEGMYPSVRNNLALILAIEARSTAAVKVILYWKKEIYSNPQPSTSAEPLIADATTDNNKPLRIAVILGVSDIVKLLLEWVGYGEYTGRRVDATVNDNEPVITAFTLGHVNVARLLMFEWSASASSVNRRLNITATETSTTARLVQLLTGSDESRGIFSIGVDPTARNNVCLLEAAKRGNVELFNLLDEWIGRDGPLSGQLVDMTLPDNEAIILAVKNDHPDFVEALLEWEGRDYLLGKRVDPTVNDYELYKHVTKKRLARIRKIFNEWLGTGFLMGKRAVPPSKG